MAEIQVALAEARVAARLSSTLDPETALDRVRRAQTELLDSPSRIRHASAWFYDPPNLLFAGTFQPDDEVLRGYEERSQLGGAEGALYLHDAANWYLALALHAGKPGQIESFAATALEKWELLLSCRDFLATQSQPVRLSPNSQSRWPEHVLGSLSAANARRCRNGETENVVACLNALRVFGCERDEVLLAADGALSYLSQKVASGLSNAQASQTETVSLANTLADDAFPLFELLTALGEDAPSQYASVLDDVCSFLRGIAVNLHNERSATQTAIEVIECALDLAIGATEEKLLADRANLQDQQRQQLVVTALNNYAAHVQEKRWDEASNSLSEASRHARSPEEFALVQAARNALEKRRRGLVGALRGVLGTIAVIGVIAAIRLAASSSDDGTSAGSSPGSAPPAIQPSTNSERERLGQQIESNKARLAQLAAQVDGLDSRLNSLEAQMNSIVRTYGVGNALREPGYSQYESLRAQYNGLVSQRNTVTKEYDDLLSQTNLLISRYNSLR
ncbi:MAG TPA: hypothetical protein VII57_02135 [Dehalococcoidia bacterium]